MVIFGQMKSMNRTNVRMTKMALGQIQNDCVLQLQTHTFRIGHVGGAWMPYNNTVHNLKDGIKIFPLSDLRNCQLRKKMRK